MAKKRLCLSHWLTDIWIEHSVLTYWMETPDVCILSFQIERSQLNVSNGNIERVVRFLKGWMKHKCVCYNNCINITDFLSIKFAACVNGAPCLRTNRRSCTLYVVVFFLSYTANECCFQKCGGWGECAT